MVCGASPPAPAQRCAQHLQRLGQRCRRHGYSPALPCTRPACHALPSSSLCGSNGSSQRRGGMKGSAATGVLPAAGQRARRGAPSLALSSGPSAARCPLLLQEFDASAPGSPEVSEEVAAPATSETATVVFDQPGTYWCATGWVVPQCRRRAASRPLAAPRRGHRKLARSPPPLPFILPRVCRYACQVASHCSGGMLIKFDVSPAARAGSSPRLIKQAVHKAHHFSATCNEDSKQRRGPKGTAGGEDAEAEEGSSCQPRVARK